MAVVLVGRPGVIEMDQRVREEQDEQSQAEQAAEPLQASPRVTSRTGQQAEQGPGLGVIVGKRNQAPRESAAMVGRPSLRTGGIRIGIREYTLELRWIEPLLGTNVGHAVSVGDQLSWPWPMGRPRGGTRARRSLDRDRTRGAMSSLAVLVTAMRGADRRVCRWLSSLSRRAISARLNHHDRRIMSLSASSIA